jgi:glucosylglycerate phosphorylase
MDTCKKDLKPSQKPDHSKFHLIEPDFSRPPFRLPEKQKKRILEKLVFLYGEENAKSCFNEISRIMKVYNSYKSPKMIDCEKTVDPSNRLTEKDIILITYGDLICGDEESPLQSLRDFSSKFIKNTINTLHILPFFPYSSDRGFSVTDFKQVDPHLGKWEDIANLKTEYRLMFDGVFNHVSSKNAWFEEFLNQNPDYIDFFESFPSKESIPEDVLKSVVRPRTTELLTKFETINGERYVWTTFSPDQIDLNYKNPKVLVKIIEILLFYVRMGADIIRLDAVTYLWNELGTSSANLKQTHTIVKIFRDVLDAVAPQVAIVTETNVPHKENIKYFGNGNDEAQMVYNFALPPIVLHAFYTGNSSKLTGWAQSLERVSDTATYFNFLDSHDGVSIQGAINILTKEEIELLEKKAVEHGGLVSYKDNGDGTVSPYEFNITWYSALNLEDSNEQVDLQIKRFIASRSIALVLMGVPGIYLLSLFGSKNDVRAVLEGKNPRIINRKTICKEACNKALENEETTTYRINKYFIPIIKKRTHEKAFHPNAPQKVLNISTSLFSILRTSEDGKEKILALTNITEKDLKFEFKPRELELEDDHWKDVLSEKAFPSENGKLSIGMEPYEVLWLKAALK